MFCLVWGVLEAFQKKGGRFHLIGVQLQPPEAAWFLPKEFPAGDLPPTSSSSNRCGKPKQRFYVLSPIGAQAAPTGQCEEFYRRSLFSASIRTLITPVSSVLDQQPHRLFLALPGMDGQPPAADMWNKVVREPSHKTTNAFFRKKASADA